MVESEATGYVWPEILQTHEELDRRIDARVALERRRVRFGRQQEPHGIEECSAPLDTESEVTGYVD